VQGEAISIGAKLGNDEGHFVRHQARDKKNISAEPIELRNRYRALSVTAGLGQRGGELRAPIEGVSPLARLDLDELGLDLEALALGKSGHGRALRLERHGCGYWGANRYWAYFLNWLYMGHDMKCLVRPLDLDRADNPTDQMLYRPILRDGPNDRSEHWYCI
jgi:hypothetical protein